MPQPKPIEVPGEAVELVAMMRRERVRGDTLPWAELPDIAKAPILASTAEDLAAAVPALRKTFEAEVRERLEDAAEHFDNVHFCAEQESLSLGAEGNHLGEFEAKGITTVAKNARDKLREVAASLASDPQPDSEDREQAECYSCGEPGSGKCPKSRRPCGHHCNCSWQHDHCHWCGQEFGEQPAPPEPQGERVQTLGEGRCPSLTAGGRCELNDGHPGEHLLVTPSRTIHWANTPGESEPQGDGDWPKVTLYRLQGLRPDVLHDEELPEDAESRCYLPAPTEPVYSRGEGEQLFTAEQIESARCAECEMRLGSSHLFRCSFEGDVDLAAAFPTQQEGPR